MRRRDSMWRDAALAARHEVWNYQPPAAGMSLVMVEYDHGHPVALVNYLDRSVPLPTGCDVSAACRAFASLHDESGRDLPFLTMRYDRRNWAMQAFPHNTAARDLLGERGWATMTERRFVTLLYHLRDVPLPDLSRYGVEWSTAPWIQAEDSNPRTEPWPGADMSARRRSYEPAIHVPMRDRIPCVDIDLAVIDQYERVALLVDYKRDGARIDTGCTNARALSGLRTTNGEFPGSRDVSVPALIAEYDSNSFTQWSFTVTSLNPSARQHLAYVLGSSGSDVSALAEAIVSGDRVSMTEFDWLSVLNCARDL